MTDKVVVGSDLTPNRLKKFESVLGEITRQLVQGLHCPGKGLSLEQGQVFAEHRNAFPTQASVVSPQGFANGGVTYASTLNVEEFLDDWAKFLRDVFRIGLPSRKKIVLPKTRVGFGWGVVMPQDLSAQHMLDVLKSRFDGKLWQWCQNLDQALNPEKEARTATNRPYVIWCRDRVEADEELKNLSANDLTERGVNCMTEPERILLEGWFHWKTSSHLDVRNVTLSAGSRYSDGGVPNANWYGFCGFYVSRFYADGRLSSIRAREVVSLTV